LSQEKGELQHNSLYRVLFVNSFYANCKFLYATEQTDPLITGIVAKNAALQS